MVFVPGGSFQMGSNDSLDYGASPPHTVTLTGFYMGKYEVTQAQYQAGNGDESQQLLRSWEQLPGVLCKLV
jgi:formylglycine-generating enzyme required for sulfatase activity